MTSCSYWNLWNYIALICVIGWGGGVYHTSAINICDNPVIFLKDISCDNSFYYRIIAALLASRAELSRCLFHFTKEKEKNTHMFESRIIFFYM